MNRSYVIRCLIAGAVWGAIAFALGSQMFPRIATGVIASPLIGLAVGWAVRGLHGASKPMRIVGAGAALYGGSALLGLVLGVAALVTRSPQQNSSVFFEPLLGILWGITFLGYVLILWPLAYFTLGWVHAALASDGG